MKNQMLSPVGQVVKAIVMAIVDFPEEVELTELKGERATVLEVSVRQSDHGKTVGRHGRLAGAMREILACHSGLENRTYVLEILEGERERSTTRSIFSTHPSHAEDAVLNTSVLLTTIVKGIVDDASSVHVHSVEGLQVVIFEVKAAPEDNRKIIGRGGRVATAIRELLLSMGKKAGRRFILELVEEKRRG